LDRQEETLLGELPSGSFSWQRALDFARELYPEAAQSWSKITLDDADHRRALAQAWTVWSQNRRREETIRSDASELPEFHRKLLHKMNRLAQAEEAINRWLTNRGVGWDLDSGDWENLDFAPLETAANQLAAEPQLTRIAELLGRDYRARSRSADPPQQDPPPNQELELGRSEIHGVRWGNDLAALVSTEAALLAFPESETLFFKKSAEAELLNWDYRTPVHWKTSTEKGGVQRQSHNDRGPIILVLDTSGSMRGKPELIAKAAVLALLRVALEEGRACYLINFSSKIQCLDLSDLKNSMAEYLRFLAFSFHGGTDLVPALREALRVLGENSFREADVLVLSDFSVPKVPTSVRRAVRHEQDNHGTRFFSLTVSVRPLNDQLNLFDGGWVYNIHPYQTNGIAPESLETWF